MMIKDGNNELEKIAEIINRAGYKEWLVDGKYIENPSILHKDNVIYYLFEVDNEVAGFCAFNKQNDDISIGDVAIIEKFRGKIGKYLSVLAIKKYIDEQKCKMIITRIDKNNKRSLIFAKWLGFKRYLNDDNYTYMRLNLWAAH